MGKKKKEKSVFKSIRKIIRDNVWFGRDDKLHGVSIAADLIDREIVEAAYQQGWANRGDEAPGVVAAKIATKHPENYLLVNVHDGTFWGLSKKGRWLRAEKIRFENRETLQTEEIDLANFGLGVLGTGSVMEEAKE